MNVNSFSRYIDSFDEGEWVPSQMHCGCTPKMSKEPETCRTLQSFRLFVKRYEQRAKLGAETLRDQLSNLDGVEGSTLTEVVTGHDQVKATVAFHRGILTDTTHQGRIGASSNQRSGDVHPFSKD